MKKYKDEVWKCFSPEGYFLSNYGRWFSIKTQQFLKQRPNNTGYLRAELQIAGQRKFPFTHISVVALFGDKNGKTFNGSLLEQGLSIDHINRSKCNNTFHNLEIVPHQENCRRYQDLKLEDIGL